MTVFSLKVFFWRVSQVLRPQEQVTPTGVWWEMLTKVALCLIRKKLNEARYSIVQRRQSVKEEAQRLLAHNDSQCHCWSEVSGLNLTRWEHSHTHIDTPVRMFLSCCACRCVHPYTPVGMYIPDFVLMYMNVCRPLLVIRRIFFFVRAVLGLSAVFLFKDMTGNMPFYYILLVWVKLAKMPKDFSIDLWYLF